MRKLSTTETAMQDQVKADQRESFKITNTSPLPTFEDGIGAGFEWVGGSLMLNCDPFAKVHPIRYAGSFGGRNVWGL